MPTATDIHRDSRVVHQRYGQGKVARVYWTDRQASVLFDGDAGRFGGPLAGKVARRVWLRDLTPEPVDMPAVVASEPRPVYRLIWPVAVAPTVLDACAGEGEV